MAASGPDIQQLDEDLAQLARHRFGFQRPGALTGLRHLLALSAVEREAGVNSDIPEARVLALRAVLEATIERIRNVATRDALRIYFFLDRERPELRESTLSARRAEIVRRLPFQDEQWRRGIEDRFRAILAGELRGLEIEHQAATRTVLPPDTIPVRFVRTATAVRRELERLVDEAHEVLVCLGSRSREASYLDRIAAKLTHEPHVVHYRILWGPPHHDVMIPHLYRLLALETLRESQDSAARVRVGLICDTTREPERFMVANEHEALFVLPPQQVGGFDSAIVFRDSDVVPRLRDYVADLHNYSQRVTPEIVQGFQPLHAA